MSSYIFFRIEARRKILDPIRCYIHSYTLCCFLFERIRDFDLLRRFFILDFVINREMSNCCIITEVSIIYQFFFSSLMFGMFHSKCAICIQKSERENYHGYQALEKFHENFIFYLFFFWFYMSWNFVLENCTLKCFCDSLAFDISISGMLQNLHKLICKSEQNVNKINNVWCLNMSEKKSIPKIGFIYIEML